MMTRRERLEAKVERRREWAAKAAARSDQRFNAAHRIADGIPLGQPILVGHHSEAHARRDAERITANMSKGVEEGKLAEHHEAKAGGLEGQLDRSVFSDDADAIEQLEARIAEHEATRDRMKRVNALYKKGDAAGLAALGLNLDSIKAKLAAAGPYWGDRPHLAYELTNLGARIRSDRERIEQIKARQGRSAQAEQAGGVLIEVKPEWNGYCRVTFAEKPERAVLDALKAAGFTWGAGHWSGPRASLPAGIDQGA